MSLQDEKEKSMSKLESALQELYRMDRLTHRNHWMNQLHPVVKLIVTIGYMISVVSTPKYDLVRLIYFMSYPVVMFALSQLSLWKAIKRMKLVFPFLLIMGIFNPFFECQPIGQVGHIVITLGMVSMLTLMLKGLLCIVASYLLIATTSIEAIGYGLYRLKVPSIIVTQFLMTYRYINVLLKEMKCMSESYAMRAPRQKGIHFRVWGVFCGQLLIQTIDRAEQVYESMTLRGYQGQYDPIEERHYSKRDVLYLVVCLSEFFILWRMT